MAAGLTNQAIVDAMCRCLGPKLQKAAQAQPRCGKDFTIADFEVTYPSKELMAEVEVTGAPAG